MPTYVSLIKYTDQGIKNAKGSPDRAEQFSTRLREMGGRVNALYWTQGAYDAVLIAEIPDEETAMAGLLALGMAGNVRTETLRAFSAEEMGRILQKLP